MSFYLKYGINALCTLQKSKQNTFFLNDMNSYIQLKNNTRLYFLTHLEKDIHKHQRCQLSRFWREPLAILLKIPKYRNCVHLPPGVIISHISEI